MRRFMIKKSTGVRVTWLNNKTVYEGKLMSMTAHKLYAPDLHWYLWAVGVSPPSQGRGIGGMLLEPVLTRASADGTACYLETGEERNIRFYERHGFKVVGEGTVPGESVKVWAMLRDGKSG